jgi:hypothetical protein
MKISERLRIDVQGLKRAHIEFSAFGFQVYCEAGFSVGSSLPSDRDLLPRVGSRTSDFPFLTPL